MKILEYLFTLHFSNFENKGNMSPKTNNQNLCGTSVLFSIKYNNIVYLTVDFGYVTSQTHFREEPLCAHEV